MFSVPKFFLLLLVIVFFGVFVYFLFSASQNFISTIPDSEPKKQQLAINESSSIKILFVGDLMFDRGIRHYAEKNGGNEFIFNEISPLLLKQSVVVANLEGPITDNKSISAGTKRGSTNNYFFTFDPSVAKTLFGENIRIVNLGNNHILNFKQSGVDSTKKYLSDNNISYFGAPGGEKGIVRNINGLRVAFVSYNEFLNSDTELEKEAVVNEVMKVRSEADITVVFCHWGVEYALAPTSDQKNMARQFIDAGADLVIGSHPHVIQPKEEYNGKTIYYSLGNFIFDQYFNENVRNGLGVEVEINKTTKEIGFKEHAFYLHANGQTILK